MQACAIYYDGNKICSELISVGEMTKLHICTNAEAVFKLNPETDQINAIIFGKDLTCLLNEE